MKKFTRAFSLFLSILMICMMIAPISAMAATPADENYVDIEVPLTLTASSPLTGSGGGTFNAFFDQGQTMATTKEYYWDWRNADVPDNATVTKVEVRSIRTNVPGMTYYVQIARGTSLSSFNWCPNILWASTVSTNYFNGQSPCAYWAVRFNATRIITPPDYGAGATVTNATLRVYFS